MPEPKYTAGGQVFAVSIRFRPDGDNPGEEHTIAFSTEENAIAFYNRMGKRDDVDGRKFIGPTAEKFPRKP